MCVSPSFSTGKGVISSGSIVCVWQSCRACMGAISPGSSCVCLAEFKSLYGSDQSWFKLCVFGRVLELVWD